MDLYYKLRSTDVMHELVLEAGRAAHMARNYAQGYVNLNHPEIATCDMICGQIEGQLRAMRAHVREEKEIKQIISPIAKAATFMCSVVSEGFFQDDAVPKERMDHFVSLLTTVRRCILRIDSEVNDAILQHSSSLFGTPAPKLCQEAHVPDAVVQKLFNPAAHEVAGEAEGTAQQGRRAEAVVQLGSCLSNKAHLLQDVCSEHIMCPVQKEHAAAIINAAGAAENESRTLIAISTAHKHFQEKPHLNHLEKLNKNLRAVRDSVTASGFSIPEKHAELSKALQEAEHLAASCRTCVTCP